MKNYFFNSFLLIFLFSFISISYAQERNLTGTVTTLENIAVAKAEVKVLSSKVTVLTDSVGNFTISCLPKDKIKVSAKGFYSQKVKIDKKITKPIINLIFKSGKKNINAALGFGHINEKDKTYAIANIINNDKNDFSKYTNMRDFIVNSSPSIVTNGGEIIIRGESSLNGSSAALIIIDGIDAGMSQLLALPPINVRSVDILKGGSAAIYGVRGANGVIIITTKRGGDND